MRSDPPTATVIIPCFNHGRFVADAVRSALWQTDAETRVVVVDDGSDDRSSPAACDACVAVPEAAERVGVIHQTNLGLPAARNTGVRASAERGWDSEYLVFLDADDWIEPGFVSRLHAEICSRETSGEMNGASISHAYCQERLTDRATGIWTVPEWDPMLLLVTNLHPVTALVKRECFLEAGGFDETMRHGYEDWDLWLRFASKGWRGVRVREPLFNWRRHSADTMINQAVARHDQLFASLMERHCELYARHASKVMALSNSLLRRADANWLDENLDAIVIRDQRAWIKDLVRERDEAREQVVAARLTSAAAESREAAARTALSEAEAESRRITASYEAKPIIRVSRAAHRWLDALPRPVAAPIRALLNSAKRPG